MHCSLELLLAYPDPLNPRKLSLWDMMRTHTFMLKKQVLRLHVWMLLLSPNLVTQTSTFKIQWIRARRKTNSFYICALVWWRSSSEIFKPMVTDTCCNVTNKAGECLPWWVFTCFLQSSRPIWLHLKHVLILSL